jgi:hypothetical protein
MKCGKGPRRPGVLIIDNYEGRDRIGNGEPTENVDRDVRVMASEVSKKQYIHASPFDCLPNVAESLLDRRLSSELVE